MEVEAQQLINLIQQMQESKNTQYNKMDEHLTRLRENIHEIKNDYHGTATLVQMMHKDVEDIKRKQEGDLTLVHSRIDKHNSEMSDNIKKIESELSEIAPMAKSWQKIYDNASKVLIGAMMLGLIAVAAGYVSK